MSGVVILFPDRPPVAVAANPHGEICVCPSGIDGGSWAVAHETSTGSSMMIGIYIDHDQAVEVARAYSQVSGARFAG